MSTWSIVRSILIVIAVTAFVVLVGEYQRKGQRMTSELARLREFHTEACTPAYRASMGALCAEYSPGTGR